MSLHDAVIDELLAKQPRLYVVASGAGAGIQKVLWDRPGTSKFLVGAEFPYDRRATSDFLGFEPDKAVSRLTAIQFAQAAYLRACRGTGTGMPIGLGLTAAVTTDRERRGENVVEVAVMTPTKTLHYSHKLNKDGASRQGDGERADEAGLWLLMSELRGWAPETTGAQVVSEQELRETLYLRPMFRADGSRTVLPTRFDVFIPGSFNPGPHVGHLGMALAVEDQYHLKPAFMLTADSLHKPPLETGELLRRASQFRGQEFPILLTQRDPLFIHKARRWPHSWFAIGVDTLERMLESKWFRVPGTTDAIPGIDSYWATNGDIGVHAMLAEFRILGTRFLVFQRNGKGLKDVNVPGDFRDLFEPVKGSWDISSTELRKAAS